MDQIPLVDLHAQYDLIKSEIDNAIQGVLNRTDFISGDEINQFEHNFSVFTGVKDTVSVASGTAALHLSLLACGIGSGDEVITTAHTFAATAEAIVHAGAKPVFVDIHPDTFLIDANKIESAITKNTKAIIPVHLYGLSVDMDPIMDLAKSYGLFVIEDAAQAHGAEYKDRKCGSMGHLGCFSFYPGKNLGAYGDAGAVTGNDEDLLKKVRMLRDHGRSAKYMHEIVGYGERMDTVQAAVLNVKLTHLREWNELRRLHAEKYCAYLHSMPVVIPFVPDECIHVYHQFVIKTPNRDELLVFLKSKGVSTGIHYPVPLHRQPAFAGQGVYHELPITEETATKILSLPMYPELKNHQIEMISETIKLFLVHSRKA